MTNIAAQLAAMRESFRPGNLSEEDAAAALLAAKRVMEADGRPIDAIVAAAREMYSGFDGLTQGALLVEAMDALMAADAVEKIGSIGILPIGFGMAEANAVAKKAKGRRK